MKKILSLVLVVLMLASVLCLAGCGDTASNTKVAVQKGTTSLMYAQILKGVEAVSYDTFALAANDMKNGNADYVFVDKTTAKALCKEISGIKMIDIALSSENYGIGIDPAQAELKTQIDAILTDKAAEIEAIKDKYMNGEEDKYVGVTSAAKDVNNAAGQLVVATNAEFAPWEYKEGNKFYGIDMEIAQILATELGLELVIDDMDFDMVVGAVGKQGVDIAMSGITITAERMNVINFSIPYYTEAIVTVCKADDTSLDAVGTVVDLLNVLCASK
ncbi:MAG: transporter substrate-binding domain-containing protein [Clostridia bacterium]|nr:transporter substrate-binding domain-containing protein [Clostridia bacterium]